MATQNKAPFKLNSDHSEDSFSHQHSIGRK